MNHGECRVQQELEQVRCCQVCWSKQRRAMFKGLIDNVFGLRLVIGIYINAQTVRAHILILGLPGN